MAKKDIGAGQQWVPVALLSVAVALSIGCGSRNERESDGGTDGGGGQSPNQGFVFLDQGEEAGSPYRTASANFYPEGVGLPPTAAQTPAQCTFKANGACVFSDCTLDGGATPRLNGGRIVGAGTVSAAVGLDLVTLTRVAGSYSATGNTIWWDGGQTTTVTATGDDAGAPAFTSTLLTPTRLSLTIANDDGGAVSVPKGTGLTVTWAAGRGEVSIWLLSGTHTRAVVAICSADASTGLFTVPGEVTNALVGGVGELWVTNTKSTTTSAGGWSIFTSASSAVRRTTDVQ